MGQLPTILVEAIERGEPITEDQLRALIEAEAKELGLSLEQAIQKAQAGTLPKGDPYADDIRSLVDLLFQPV